jgi:hypothetical protein
MATHIVYIFPDSGTLIAELDYVEALPGKPIEIGTVIPKDRAEAFVRDGLFAYSDKDGNVLKTPTEAARKGIATEPEIVESGPLSHVAPERHPNIATDAVADATSPALAESVMSG